MRILFTGADGYIGALLGSYLAERGLEVVGLDTGYYREGWLYPLAGKRPEIITKDIRDITEDDLRGFDAIAHLAELSNDPLGQQNPELTFEINHQGSVRLAEMAKRAGVERFVYTSSCSVYGVGSPDQVLDETSEVNPQTAYAECKVRVERDLRTLTDDTFTTCFLRNATAYGASPRQRFDIVLNDLSGLAWTTKQIKLLSDGTPWRPLVHVLDICQAIYLALLADKTAIAGEAMNVGSTEQNYRVIDIAEIVAAEFPDCELIVGEPSADNRSYRVNFDKIKRLLPEFECQWTAQKGAAQLHRVFQAIDMSGDVFQAPPYTRLKMLMKHKAAGLLTDDLYWSMVDF